MKRNRQLEIGVALVLAFIVCACGASTRQKSIRISYETVALAATELPDFTRTRGKAIVDDAKAAGKTKEQASAELETFLAKATKADGYVKAAINMCIAAAVLDDDRSLAALLRVVVFMQAALKDIGWTP